MIFDSVLGAWIGELPRGCELCMRGSKIVIFVTGMCYVNCPYCPISTKRRRPDAFYVDEEHVESLTTIIDEAVLIDAEGASITGGEPLCKFDTVTQILRLLKDVLGSEFHIHMYTTGWMATRDVLKNLERHGLDELRIHPVAEWSWRVLEKAVECLTIDVGVEIPAIPLREALKFVVLRAARAGAKFININELEATESNYFYIAFSGYRVSSDGRSVVGSREAALYILEWAERAGIDIAIHFCPTLFKDRAQHRARLRRKAFKCRTPYQEVTDDGLIRDRDKEFVPTLDRCAPLVGEAHGARQKEQAPELDRELR